MGTAWGHQAPGLDAEDSPGLSWFLMDLGMVAVTFSLLPTALEDRNESRDSQPQHGIFLFLLGISLLG